MTTYRRRREAPALAEAFERLVRRHRSEIFRIVFRLARNREDAEDLTQITPSLGAGHNPNVRADMVLLETSNGGAVFSVGSISWFGSLSHNDYSNNVSKVTENVLRKFIK